jgi:hypothetical protein
MELPPRSEGELADCQRRVQKLEMEKVWLEGLLAIVASRFQFGAPIVDDEELESPTAPTLKVERVALDNDGWVIHSLPPTERRTLD